jgi:cytidylate kinase
MIIAVDGPAASGKGTVARALARHYKLPYLDTGLLYRAVGLNVQRMGLDPEQEADAVAATAFDDALLDDPALRDDDTGLLASIVSAHPLVRAALFQRQRRFAAQAGGAVLDGRDIGTVIAPEADAKLFVKATPNIRARDARDSGRSAAPLAMAADAALLDTSFLSIEASVQRAIALVDARRAAKTV